MSYKSILNDPFTEEEVRESHEENIDSVLEHFNIATRPESFSDLDVKIRKKIRTWGHDTFDFDKCLCKQDVGKTFQECDHLVKKRTSIEEGDCEI